MEKPSFRVLFFRHYDRKIADGLLLSHRLESAKMILQSCALRLILYPT